jgi:hypothetical protein
MPLHAEPLSSPVEKRLLTLKLIAFGLIAGVIIFAIIIATMQRPAAGLSADELNILRMACGVLFLTGFVVALVMRHAAKSKLGTMQPPPDEIIRLNYFATASIVTLAMLEAPALLACVVAMLSQARLDLVLAVPPLLLMVWFIPTESKWRGFAESAHSYG